MSSGTRYESNAGKRTIAAAMQRIARLGMSPRQQQLNQLWAHYRCQQYDARRVDWDGRETTTPVEHEAIASAGFIPPGFYDAGGQMLPLKFRRPTAPYNLIKVIVDRFTGLLFSARRHPQIRVDGDSMTEDFAQAMVETARLWPAMIQARTFGGATGTVAVGFEFQAGRPTIEVHDPRWLRPEFVDRATMELSALEKRFMFPQEVNVDGEWVQQWYWYRRLIDREHDILWKPVPVGEGDEPEWDNPELVESAVEHGLGFVPVQWIQNLPVTDDIDGDPDCHGIFDIVESIDALISQANRGTIANCDPTVVIVSPDSMQEVAKGSNNAIKLTAGSAQYMELSGSGPKAARELAEEFRAKALEVAQCVLEHPEVAQRTATEIERMYSSMIAKADVLREQYGERGVRPLVEKMLKAARIKTRPVQVPGGVERGELSLPMRTVTDASGVMRRVPRQLGPGGAVHLQWPGYFDAGLTDVNQAVAAAASAKAASLVDDEHAIRFVAQYFGVENVKQMVDQINGSADDIAADSLSALHASTPASAAPSKVELTATDMAGIITVDEARASAGLPPLGTPDGRLTVAEFKAKHAGIISTAAQAEAGQIGSVEQPS